MDPKIIDETPASVDGTPTSVDVATEEPINWQGNKNYFQTGSKAGTKKPRAARAGTSAPDNVGGLDIETLRATPTQNNPDKSIDNTPDKKSLKLEKKLIEAKIGAKLVMRILDTLTSFISRGSYGADFTAEQRKTRNLYRDELERDWQDYLVTLDIPLHPALVAVFGSVMYVQDAFNTPAGIERTKTWKEKIIGAVVSKVVNK